MPQDLADSETAALAELVRQALAAEGPARSARSLLLLGILAKLDPVDDRGMAAPLTPREAWAKELADEWKDEVSAEDISQDQVFEQRETDRRRAVLIGSIIVAVSALLLVILLAFGHR